MGAPRFMGTLQAPLVQTHDRPPLLPLPAPKPRPQRCPEASKLRSASSCPARFPTLQVPGTVEPWFLSGVMHPVQLEFQRQHQIKTF